MSSEIREDLCPLCGQPNACGAHALVRCWCHDTAIPSALLELIPPENQWKACVCRNCIETYRQNAKAVRAHTSAGHTRRH